MGGAGSAPLYMHETKAWCLISEIWALYHIILDKQDIDVTGMAG